jgi:RND family efflux transporter MFP subunit
MLHRRSTTWLLGLAALAACAPEPSGSNGAADTAGASVVSNAERAPVDVTLAKAERTSLQRSVETTGALFGEEQVTLSAKVSGRVHAVLHDVGDEVDSGEVLARQETLDYELAVAERERAFEQGLASLGLQAMPDASFSVAGLPTVESARARAANAKARFDRGEVLYRSDSASVSDQELADLSTAYDVARSELALAELDVRAQIAELRTLSAQIATARQRLADTQIAAPVGLRPGDRDGVAAKQRYAIAQRLVGVGDFVTVGAPLFELVDRDPIELRVRVPEKHAAAIAVGQAVKFSIEGEAERLTGRVTRLQPMIDPRTRTLEVRIEAPNPEGRLRVGAFARAEIFTHVDTRALVVPRSAVTVFAGVPKLFVVEEGRVKERLVALGAEAGDSVEVVSGLSEGESYVLAPPANLAGGTPVRAAEATR